MSCSFRIDVRTRNPLNSQSGNSRLAAILRARERHVQRGKTRLVLGNLSHLLPCAVTITRVAPSQGLDPHDGLGASLKAVIDGTADALGLKSDRDPRVAWSLAQRRGRPKEYAVEIDIRGNLP